MQENLKEGHHTPMPKSNGVKNGKREAILGFTKEKLLYPFKQDLLYFLLLWILIALPNCYSQHNHTTYAIYLAMMYYIITYVVVVIINLHKQIARVLKPIIFIFSTILTMLNLYCYKVYSCLLSNDFFQIIAATNPSEAQEYFDTFVSWDDVVLFLLILAISILVTIILSKIRKVEYGKSWIVASGVLLLSIGAIIHNSGIIKEEFADKQRWNFNFAEVVDLKNHPTHPSIEESDSIHPEQVVVILGESFSSNHSSLYGYGRNTNPLLKKQVEQGNLFVFKNVKSPSTHTTNVFKYLLNTFQVGQEDGQSWYESTNIIEVMKTAGYHTIWISNQLEKGMFDNIPSGHGNICDEKYYMENESYTDKYDSRLIEKALAIKQNNSTIFYHLMGQHENFQERYPKEYEHFKGSDYAEYPEHQRATLASYDNATLYNDYVVNSIINLYKDKDAVVFYFSDHALDVFDTAPNYFGHAKQTEASQKQGKKIPFMVYVSPLFQERHPDKVERMRASIDKPFCTDKFIYAVMDVAGYRFADNDDVKKYSLFE